MRTPLKWLKEEGVFGYNYWYLMLHPWKIFYWGYRYSYWFFQRGRRGWADCDAWGMDYYLSRIIDEMLEAQYKDPQGTPMSVFEEGDIAPDGNPTDVASKMRHEQWKAILYKIQTGFKAHLRLCDLDFWDSNDHTGSLVRQHALQRQEAEGLALFTKYFGSLWN